MNSGGNIEHEFVKWGDKSEKPSEEWANSEGGEEIPCKKFDDASFARVTLFPGNSRMKNVCKDCGE